MFYGGKGLLTDVSEAVILPERLFFALPAHYESDRKTKVKKIKDFA
jgi:hypothetical protein